MKFLSLVFVAMLSACVSKPSQVGDKPMVRRIPIASESLSAPLVGGLSGLFYAANESTPKVSIYYSLTDRGPNGKPVTVNGVTQRPFLEPAFSPKLLRIAYDRERGTAAVTSRLSILKANGRPATGLPNSARAWNPSEPEEKPVDSKGRVLAFDPDGFDSESMVRDAAGRFWIGEEYGPSLLKVAADGRIEKRWSPGKGGLPEFLKRRQNNRGFEAMTWNSEGHLLLFLQSSLPEISKSAAPTHLIPVIEFDPVQEKTVGLYLYEASPAGGKLGDATVSRDGSILVIEQNGKTGDKAWQRVVRVVFSKSLNVLAAAEGKGIGYEPEAGGLRATRSELFDLTALGLSDLEKIEGLAMGPDGELAIVNDNDFGLESNTPSFLILVPGGAR